MQDVIGDGHIALRVPENEIGIATDRDRALAWVESVEPCRLGRGERDEARQIQPSLADTAGEQQRQPGLDTGTPFGI